MIRYFCGGTQPLKTTSLGGAWMSRNTSTTLSSCQDFPVSAEKGVHWFRPWSQPSRTQRNRVGVQIYGLDTSQGTSFDCWVCASGRIFWILLSTTGEIHWGLKKINQRWESSDLLNLSLITLKIRIPSHVAIRHWDAKSLVKFLFFQAVESALPMWCLISSGHGILTFAEQLNKQIRLPHNRLQWGQIVLSAVLKYGLQ